MTLTALEVRNPALVGPVGFIENAHTVFNAGPELGARHIERDDLFTGLEPQEHAFADKFNAGRLVDVENCTERQSPSPFFKGFTSRLLPVAAMNNRQVASVNQLFNSEARA